MVRRSLFLILWAFLIAGSFWIFSLAKDPRRAAEVRYFLGHGRLPPWPKLPPVSAYTITVRPYDKPPLIGPSQGELWRETAPGVFVREICDSRGTCRPVRLPGAAR
jgi:hypothetical protein